VGAEAIESAAIEVRYEGYIERQRRAVDRAARNERMELPDGLFEQPLAELSSEGREKIRRFMPRTVAQASRIPGVSPADIAVLTIYAERERRLDAEQPRPGSGARLPHV
jgi:tRNA uridine 5-carboxymethylaminomethyl modification enzyme